MKAAKSTQFRTHKTHRTHPVNLSDQATCHLQRILRQFIAVGLCLFASGQVAMGQYTPWDPVVAGDYSLREVVSVGANNLMTMSVSCHESQLRISLLIAASTPRSTAAAENSLHVTVGWDNEPPVDYAFTRQSNQTRTFVLHSDESSEAASFVARWLLHGRMRVKLPASPIYPLPVFESWSLTGTSAEWNALGCEHPDPDEI